MEDDDGCDGVVVAMAVWDLGAAILMFLSIFLMEAGIMLLRLKRECIRQSSSMSQFRDADGDGRLGLVM